MASSASKDKDPLSASEKLRPILLADGLSGRGVLRSYVLMIEVVIPLVSGSLARTSGNIPPTSENSLVNPDNFLNPVVFRAK